MRDDATERGLEFQAEINRILANTEQRMVARRRAGSHGVRRRGANAIAPLMAAGALGGAVGAMLAAVSKSFGV